MKFVAVNQHILPTEYRIAPDNPASLYNHRFHSDCLCKIIYMYVHYFYNTFLFHVAQPLHWVYDDNVMIKATSSNPSQPEFLPAAANPFYRRPLGSQSQYGDQMMVLLHSLASCKGIFFS